VTTLDAAHKCAIYALLRAGVVAVLAAIMPAAPAFAFDAVTLDNRIRPDGS
jgi:hypothetical protein